MISLGIETSCDETSLAVVNNNKSIIYHKIYSQIGSHKKFNGVMPEIASRLHLNNMQEILLNMPKELLKIIDCVAVTSGPGLIGCLNIGIIAAKTIANIIEKPIININHVEAHALSVRLEHEIEMPYIAVILSGGHSEILLVNDISNYEIIGSTLDDAMGEAFDKISIALGLSYPGGPEIEKRAINGNENAIRFPRAMCNKNNCDFSFSGIKTAVSSTIKTRGKLDEQQISDICASFQKCCTDILENKITKAIKIIKKKINGLVLSGGVASNNYIHHKIKSFCNQNNIKFYSPSKQICTDNAAMIAWSAIEIQNSKIKRKAFIAAEPQWAVNKIAELY